MKVVVSGATGFLGGHTLKFLKHVGLEVVGTSRTTDMPRENILRVKSFDQMPEGDVLIHFAESNSRFEVNAIGSQYVTYIRDTLNVLSRKYNRVVYASSVAVYPDNLKGLRIESERLEPLDTYSMAKLTAEKIVLDSNKNPLILRIGNAYGPGMSDLNVISAILRQFTARKNKIELVSTDPVRDYVWCEDIANAFYKMCDSPATGIFNLATGNGHSVLEICKIVEKITGHENYEIVTQKQIPYSSIILNISKATEHLNWIPSMTLEQGLSKLLKEKIF